MRISGCEVKNAEVFETLLENFPDMIHSIDEDGNIIFTNATAERLLGYTREELLSMNIRDLYPPEILPMVEEGFSELKVEGVKTVESLLMTKDGLRVPVEIRSFSIYDDDGKFQRTFSILRDIRQIKDLQDSLVHAGRLAAIGELASGIVHDINNPLTVILLSNELQGRKLATLEDKELAETLGRMTGDVRRAAESIQKLCQHLRNFSRGTAEAKERCDLGGTISDALFIAGSKVNHAGVCVDNKVQSGQYYVTGSPNRLEQVFVNLITNASDAMFEQSSAQLDIGIAETTFDSRPCWKVTVADNGPGIPGAAFDRIFNSFFTTKPKGEGTGLGLSIARGVVEEHAGEITAVTELGKGTTFSVCLPLDAGAPEADGA